MVPSAPVSSVSASASASTSALPSDAEPSTAAFSHISRASAAEAIQHLDRYAFPDTLPTSAVSSLKRRKVSDVVESRASRFSNLAGLSQLHRERARLRRSERLAASSCSGKGRGKAKGEEEAKLATSFQPFSLSLLLQRLSTFSMSTYSTKPAACAALGPVALAMRGWMHTSGRERDVLTCATCQAEWKAEVRGGLSDMEREQAWKTVEESIQSRHLAWCPWRLRGCHGELS